MLEEINTEEKPTNETPLVKTEEQKSEAKETTAQVSQVTPPELRNPEGKGGFGDHPENRNPSGWKRTETFRYWFDKFKEMTIDELEAWDKETPKNIRTVAADLAFKRVYNAQTDLKEFQEVADRSEGKAPQTINHEGGFFSSDVMKLVIVDERTETEQETTPDSTTT